MTSPTTHVSNILSLHDALPISAGEARLPLRGRPQGRARGAEPRAHLRGAEVELRLVPLHPDPRPAAGGGRREDRKSTRLNSSHLVISYAFFCFKKETVNMIST